MIERYAIARKNQQRLAAVFATLALGPNLVACSTSAEEKNVATDIQCAPISRTAEGIRIPMSEVVCNLGLLAIKDSIPENEETKYDRDKQFGSGWRTVKGCSTRETILRRDLTETVIGPKCEVLSGKLHDPYSGKDTPFFSSPEEIGKKIEIDHVVALSDAWQKGAQEWSPETRKEFANDGLNLLAVETSVNRDKSDNDISEWEPPDKSEGCELVAHQVVIKTEYDGLWVTPAEHTKMETILSTCSDQTFVIAD